MKKLLTIGVGLLGVGLIILGVAYALIGGDLRKTATDSKFEEKQTTFQTADIKNLLVEVATDEVEITGTDKNEITVSYYETKTHQFEVTAADGSVIVKSKHEPWRFSFLFDFSWLSHERAVRIQVPQKLLKKIDLTSSTGSLRINDVTATKEIVAKSTTGDITIKQAMADSASFTSTTGSLRFDKLTVDKELSAKTTTGNIDGNLTGKQSDYRTEVKTSTGSSNITNQAGGNKELKLHTTTGDIQLSFND
ncbi:DUF4097 domain-containing protein [Candidatus Saccharibacteria bacterium oral taxon 488]|nr:DUF4097 domain-containing protein [Candidatus Saccharibacteria bacterium oral taxon 488]